MPALIEELKGQHEALKRMLLLFEQHPNREDQQKLLAAARRKLAEHIELEDAKLYPFLREQAQNDRELARMLSIFDEDMRRVSALVETFFVRYGGGWDNDYEFLMDLAELKTRLVHRIEIEEKHLYPEYLARRKNPGRKLKKGLLDRLRSLLGRS